MNEDFEDYLIRYEQSDNLLDSANYTTNKTLRNKYIKQAIEICPENKHGYFLQIFYMENNEKKFKKLNEAIKKEEEFLLKENFFEDKGSFWGMHETRYYIRLLMEKSKMFKMFNKYNNSIKVCCYILELNESDNNGIRYELAGLYLFKGLLNEYIELRKQYEEYSLYFNFLDLIYFYKINDFKKLKNQIKIVKEQNEFIIKLIKNNKKVLSFNEYSFGSKEEAACIYDFYVYLLNDEEDFIQYIQGNK